MPPSYIDLGHFVQLLTRSIREQAVVDAAQKLCFGDQDGRHRRKARRGKTGRDGHLDLFPQFSALRQSGRRSGILHGHCQPLCQRVAVGRFPGLFLHRAHALRKRRAPSPFRSAGPPSRAPGAGQIQISRIRLSGKTAAPGKPVALSVDVDGKNVGYVKLFAGFYDRAANSINVTDEDYLQSSQTREVSGVYYPVWPESGKFTVKFEWEPIVFAINDGKRSVVARFAPETYGASSAQAIYTVEGLYTFADGSGSRSARLYFRDLLLRQVVVFTATTRPARRARSRPNLAIPLPSWKSGSTWISAGTSSRRRMQKGETLTFGDQPFTWKELDAAAGEYVVGFIVEDLDGNPQTVFERIVVR